MTGIVNKVTNTGHTRKVELHDWPNKGNILTFEVDMCNVSRMIKAGDSGFCQGSDFLWTKKDTDIKDVRIELITQPTPVMEGI